MLRHADQKVGHAWVQVVDRSTYERTTYGLFQDGAAMNAELNDRPDATYSVELEHLKGPLEDPTGRPPYGLFYNLLFMNCVTFALAEFERLTGIVIIIPQQHPSTLKMKIEWMNEASIRSE
jgi:hypothetical protein